ncbi:hypothetical protein [Verrucosispora sp. WMMC514]|uniref:hypothetical protein n=1 Tax=Verrucosispora sp. WMMC514 TaxID=3015156 RepID=UPI00248C66D2|nr:hypothetical protein [Verrucosispora sp. WMMC514]WBB94126.1 hypothetical protein O7597_14855 [Verrucosispora sp. WMMC514]
MSTADNSTAATVFGTMGVGGSGKQASYDTKSRQWTTRHGRTQTDTKADRK